MIANLTKKCNIFIPQNKTNNQMDNQEHSTSIAAAIGGSLFASFEGIKKFIYSPINTSYAIDWVETLQICWKAAIGALVGLIVKAIWDKLFKSHKP